MTTRRLVKPIKKIETTVKTPARFEVDEVSFTSQLARLDRGNYAARVKELGHLTGAEMQHEGVNIRRDLRNNISSSVGAANKRTGHQYGTEVFNIISPTGRTYVIAIVQRLS